MVYCGKASRGCQNCRARRIKCDTLQPGCSQCIRAGKKCPGYRDQLSLMFRDESSKVIQKAHAQWGVGEGPDDTSTSPSGSTSSTQAKPDVLSLAPSRRLSTVSASSTLSHTPVAQVGRSINPSLDDQGANFFINRYIIGHPDEPRTPEEFNLADWSSDPALRDVMVAVGLAGLANLKENHQQNLLLLARKRYGMALRQTGQLVQSRRAPSLEVTMRAIVSLAMFELVKGENLDIDNVLVHIMGGVALIRSSYPVLDNAFGGIRGLIQLLYTMFVSAHMTGTPVPPLFHDLMTFGRSLQQAVDVPSTTLGILIARFIDLASLIYNRVLKDDHASTTSIIQQLLDVDRDFAEWELGLEGPWLYRIVKAKYLPPQAVFQGEYHTYHDMWFARMWSYYRWARLLVNQAIVELMDSNPLSSSNFLSYDRSLHLEMIRTLARDVLVSMPTHWRHPLLGDRMLVPVEKQGGGGSGAAGVIMIIFQIKAAACSVGIPEEYWDWTQSILHCIWRDMGMLHAKNMMDQMSSHKARVQKTQSFRVLA